MFNIIQFLKIVPTEDNKLQNMGNGALHVSKFSPMLKSAQEWANDSQSLEKWMKLNSRKPLYQLFPDNKIILKILNLDFKMSVESYDADIGLN